MPISPTDDEGVVEKNGIQVISRAATILRALEQRPEGLSLSAIAKAVALPRSTVQRIVDALEREGLVLASAAGEIRLGPAILRLAAATRFDIAEQARPVMLALAQKLGETIILSIGNKDKVVNIEHVLGQHHFGVLIPLGILLPLHCSSTGKAFLAALDEGELERVKKRIRLTRETENSKTSWTALEQELKTIRESGVAFDHDECSPGVSAVSVAIRKSADASAMLTVLLPSQRLTGNEAVFAAALKDACASLKASLESGQSRGR